MDCPNNILTFGTNPGGRAASLALAAIGASNDNVHTPRTPVRESFATEDFVATRRFLKVQNQILTEGSIGRILRVRSPGRLYDVSFQAADFVTMTLSHCDIARHRGRQH